MHKSLQFLLIKVSSLEQQSEFVLAAVFIKLRKTRIKEQLLCTAMPERTRLFHMFLIWTSRRVSLIFLSSLEILISVALQTVNSFLVQVVDGEVKNTLDQSYENSPHPILFCTS
ncbi:hypothetical protein AMECASPLE_039247 [Ameca splendens]|uniref:Uncharacterized protein n=1 Tax=Ameca splendens TaxID=208324 RepID=A0ABV0Y8M3_9TELE